MLCFGSAGRNKVKLRRSALMWIPGKKFSLMAAEKKERKVYIEAIRVIATLFVLLNHVPANMLYQQHEGAARYALLAMMFVSRTCIPFFYMVSGALLLDHEEPFGVVMKKRILRFVAVLFVAELGIYLANAAVAYLHHTEIQLSPFYFLSCFIAGKLPGAETYWYLYAYLSMLFLLPFLRPIVKGLGKKEFLLLLIPHVVICGILPIYNRAASSFGLMHLEFSDDLGFPLAVWRPAFCAVCGYVLMKKIKAESIRPRHLLILFAASVLGVAAGVWATLDYAEAHGEYVTNYYHCVDYIITAFFVLLLRYLFEVRFKKLSKGRFAKILCFFGPLCFGVYLLDPFLKMALYPAYTRLGGGYTDTLLFSLGWVFFSFLACSLLTRVLKMIPGVKRFI